MVTQALVEEYRSMLEINDFDYTITTSEFIDRFGVNPLPLIQPKRKPNVRTPYTESSVQFWTKKENREVMEFAPRTAYYIRPDTLDDDWVWSGDFNALREYYTEEQWDLLARQTLLERELRVHKEELEAIAKDEGYSRNWVEGNYALKRRELESADKYGIKGFSSIGVGEVAADNRLDVIELYTWKNNETLRNSAEFTPLNLYLKKRDEAEQVLLNGGIFEGGKFAPPKRPTLTTVCTDRKSSLCS